MKDVWELFAKYRRAFCVCVVFAIIGTVDIAISYFLSSVPFPHGAFKVLMLSCAKAMMWAMLVAAIVELMGGASRLAVPWVGLYAVIIVSIELYVRVNFRTGIGGSWYTLLMASSYDEMVEFASGLTMIGMFISAGVVVTLGVSVFVVLKKVSIGDRSISRAVALLICYAMLYFVVGRVGYGCVYIEWLAKTVHDIKTYMSMHRFREINVDDSYFCPDVDKCPICVYVIGESATRSHLGCYGYGRDTTPMMTALGFRCLDNVQAAATYTVPVMRCLMTDAEISNLQDFTITMPSLLKKCGFYCSLISTQGNWGNVNSFESLLFSGCDEKDFCRDALCVEGKLYDDAVLKPFSRCLRERTGALAVFVHLQGSHQPFPTRYRACDAPFVPSRENGFVDEYDNSIAFTDRVLGGLISLLKTDERPSVLFYISDHGESPDSGSWRVSSDDDIWQVPACAWFSSKYEYYWPEIVRLFDEAKNIPLQSDSIFYGVAHLFGIRGVKAERDFLNPAFIVRKRVRELSNEGK